MISLWKDKPTSNKETKWLLSSRGCLKSTLFFNVWVRYFVWNFKGAMWNSTQISDPYIERCVCYSAVSRDRTVIISASVQAPIPLTVFWSNSKFNQHLECSSLKHVQLITMTFCTCHDNYVCKISLIGRVHFKPEHIKFWSNFKFDRNIVSGTGARPCFLISKGISLIMY